MAFRALGSALARHVSRTSAASTAWRPSVVAASHKVSANQAMWRSFAAEAGYLDKEDVTGRVLEVVRKFEKVSV